MLHIAYRVWDTLQDHRYLWTGVRTLWCLWLPIPSIFLTSIFFHVHIILQLSMYDIQVHVYTKKQSNSSFYPYWVSDICIRFWKCFSSRHFGQLCILSIPDRLMQLSKYKKIYKLEFALGIIQSRRSGCAIVLFLATRYCPCRIR